MSNFIIRIRTSKKRTAILGQENRIDVRRRHPPDLLVVMLMECYHHHNASECFLPFMRRLYYI